MSKNPWETAPRNVHDAKVIACSIIDRSVFRPATIFDLRQQV